MTNIDSLLNDIRARARSLFKSKAGIAKGAKLHINTLRKFDSSSWSPSVETIRSLERAVYGQKRSRVDRRGP